MSLHQNFYSDLKIFASQFKALTWGFLYFAFVAPQYINDLFFEASDMDMFLNPSSNIMSSLSSLLMFEAVNQIIFLLIYFYFFYNMGRLSDFIKPKLHFLEFTRTHILEFFILSLQVFSKTLLYAIALILPGLIYSFRASLIYPYLFFDSAMEDENFEPIQKSLSLIPIKSWTWGYSFLIFAISTLFYIYAYYFLSFKTEPILKFLILGLNLFSYFAYTAFQVSLYKTVKLNEL